jgi:hypothetical protein
MGVEPGVAGPVCVPVSALLATTTTDHPEGLVLVPDEPVVVRLRFTDDHGVGRRVVDIGESTLIRFPEGIDGEVTVNPVGSVTGLQACRPRGGG